ncbi:MAG: thermonuclease family protein [Cyclobacteriaceae bacterium]|nr:thermonuclease family protein [Cyclobacteriaceae bacterium]
MKAFLTMVLLSVTVYLVEANTIRGKVISVVDGNTLEVISAKDETYRIVLAGIDCPEPGQPYAEEAKMFLENAILRKLIDVKLLGKDRWGNYLGQIIAKVEISTELVKRGLAWCIEKDASEDLRNLERQARAGQIGIWQEESPTPPWVYRRQQTMLTPKSS